MACSVQVKILTIVEKHHEYALNVQKDYRKENIRVEIDLRNEKIGYKIREAQLEKVPYMLIIGDKEMENDAIAIRSRKEGDLGQMTVDSFINKIINEVNEKVL